MLCSGGDISNAIKATRAIDFVSKLVEKYFKKYRKVSPYFKFAIFKGLYFATLNFQINKFKLLKISKYAKVSYNKSNSFINNDTVK